MALVFATVLLGSCAGGEDDEAIVPVTAAPRDDFCSLLRDGTRTLDERTASAGDSTSAQLQLLVENYADFSRLLRRLEAVAPPEIKRDMEAVVSDWESQADTASEAAKNPFGAVAGALVRGLLSGASYKAIDDFALRNCGRRLFGPATDDVAAAAEAAAAGMLVVKDGPDEPAVVVCQLDGLRLLHVGLVSGNLRHATPDHTSSVGNIEGIYFDGDPSGAVCDSPPRTLFSSDFSHIIGVASFSDRTQVPVVVDLEATALQPQVAVSAGPLRDFGTGRPETLAASFTPDGRGLFWRESSGGRCSSYLVPNAPEGQTLPRDAVAQYKIGDGGNCYNANMTVRWAGTTPTVCTASFGCDDANGDEVKVDRGEVTELSASGLPRSERYNLRGALSVEERGVKFFIGEDRSTKQSVLFSWAGGNSEPVKMRDLGLGRFSVVAYRPSLR